MTQAAKGRTVLVLPSCLYPSCAVMLNWRSADLRQVADNWLLEGALQLNRKLAGQCGATPLAAITRLDVSKNKLTTLPAVVFQLTSLRILNASHNLIEHLPTDKQWNVAVLEEVCISFHSRLIPNKYYQYVLDTLGS